MQIIGGYGFVKDFRGERYMRDSKITQGSTKADQIQRVITVRKLLG